MKWKNLPFVFAAWVSNKELPDDFINQFNKALKFGIEHKKKSLESYDQFHLPLNKLEEYIENQISYNLDNQKKKSLNIFLNELNKLQTAS